MIRRALLLTAALAASGLAAAVDTDPAEIAERQRQAAALVADGPALLEALESAEHAARAGLPLACGAEAQCSPWESVTSPLGRAAGEALLPVIEALRLLLPTAIQDARGVAQP